MKTRLAIIIGFFALMGLALMLMPASKTAPRQQRTLPDGSLLTLEEVTYGGQHTFHFDDGWWTRLQRGLPPSMRRIFPTRGGRTTTMTGTNGIVFWMSRFDPKAAGPNRGYVNVGGNLYELRIEDEHGCSQQLSGYSSSSGGGGKLINGFGLDIFPRRQKSFKLMVRDRGGKEPRKIVAEFDVPNPGPVSHPVWKPEPLPQSRTNGGLEFVLTKWRTSTYDSRLSVYPAYEIHENGVKRKDWMASSTRYHDASGNSYWQSLCTNESAWKLESEFRRTGEAQFAPEEIWAVTNLPLPGTNQIIITNLTGEVLGAKMNLFALAGPGSYTLTNGVPAPPGTVLSANFSSTSSSSDGKNSWSRKSHGSFTGNSDEQFDITQARHFLLIDEGEHDREFSLLVRGRDEQGRPIEVIQQGYADRRAIISLMPKEGATRMNLDFIMNRRRVVEFLAAPPVVEEKKRR